VFWQDVASTAAIVAASRTASDAWTDAALGSEVAGGVLAVVVRVLSGRERTGLGVTARVRTGRAFAALCTRGLRALERQARRAAWVELFFAQAALARAAACAREGVAGDCEAAAEPAVRAAQETIDRAVRRSLRGADTLLVSTGHPIRLSVGG
jgi:hypothetical protein